MDIEIGGGDDETVEATLGLNLQTPLCQLDGIAAFVLQ